MKLHDLLKSHWHGEIYEVKDSSRIPTEIPFFFIVKGESSINFVAGGRDHELRDPSHRTSETLYTPEPVPSPGDIYRYNNGVIRVVTNYGDIIIDHINGRYGLDHYSGLMNDVEIHDEYRNLTPYLVEGTR